MSTNTMDRFHGLVSTHAEINAVKKLDLHRFQRKQIKIDLYVIKLSRSGALSMSLPCKHCVENLYKSGLNIKWIYYSNSDGDIVRTTLLELMNGEQYVTRGQRT